VRATSCCLLLSILGACEGQSTTKPSWIALPTTLGDGSRVELIAMDSGLCLEIGGAGHYDRNPVQLAVCSHAPRQQFRFEYKNGGLFQIVNLGSGKCVDVDSASMKPLADIMQWSCGENSNQQMLVKNRGSLAQFQARHSGLCLDVKSAGKEAGTPLIQWPCSDAPNQRFLIVNAEPPQARR
jgi:hypothetical protein